MKSLRLRSLSQVYFFANAGAGVGGWDGEGNEAPSGDAMKGRSSVLVARACKLAFASVDECYECS